MYSRKFNGVGILPPDYSGVALRETPREQSAQYHESESCRPRHPVFEDDPSDISTYPQKESESIQKKPHSKEERHEIKEPPRAPSFFSMGNFTLEDIILAGLLLLIMNDSDSDSGLPLILGLLLLAGM